MDQGSGPHASALDGAQGSKPERHFKCLMCRRTFRRVGHLTRHARSHGVERHLECSSCSKTFYRLDALKRHEKVHSDLSGTLLEKGARACLACAASRRKCSGETPCWACERRSLKCKYPAVGSARGSSNGSGDEQVVTSPGESIRSSSNSLKPPAGTSQSPTLTVLEHTPSQQNRAENRYNNQPLHNNPLFYTRRSPEQPQLRMEGPQSAINISSLIYENQSILNSYNLSIFGYSNHRNATSTQFSNVQNEYYGGPQSTGLWYQGGFPSADQLRGASPRDCRMEDGDEDLDSFDQGSPHLFGNAPDICEVGHGIERTKCDEGQPHCTRCEGRNLNCTCVTSQLPQDRSQSLVSMQRDGYAHGEVSMSLPVNTAAEAFPTVPMSLLELNVPAFTEFSEKRNRRALVDYFCNVFSHLVVFSEDPGDPFRQLILPLARKESPVINAIYALSSAHLESRGVHTEEKSSYFHNKATRGLARLINHQERSSKEDVLGAIMLLVYYEALVQRDSSNMVIGHLKGVMTIMKSYSQPLSPTSMFLLRLFQYYDVITALSFSTTPISSAPTPLLPLNTLRAICPSAYNDFDSLLGMAANFWHTIHRLSLLCELKAEIQKAESCSDTMKAMVLRTELECNSNAIEHLLTQWKPSVQWPSQPSKPILPATIEQFGFPCPTTTSPDWAHDLSSYNNATNDGLTYPDAHILSVVDNGEAYRHAALVFLYRNIYELDRSNPKVKMHVRLTLDACVRVVGWAGPMPALLWPMFIGSVEAISEEDRSIATMAFTGTERRQGMLNITRSWEIVKEVWQRGNDGEEVDWRTVCKEKGVSLVFG
ncbi:hypothetical protein V497_02222 [Pseudogymnoascus sp. VKM F-4516 (FW-969)]|nr:hypothetical protein V490_00702 [Pseudogymnoascus sp. VKM F-3557]KFY62816.1 hypothetical protein V497_02222 [Pseudogymnoascus sp. VKM F-4516 (FW-969)]